LKLITYTYASTPTETESFRRDFEAHRREIASRLNVFPVPWEKEFFGMDKELTIHIKFSGKIIVSGKDEERCKTKITDIQRTLSEIFSVEIPYREPTLEEVKLERDAEADISRIVYAGLLEIVKTRISEEYDVKDISFVFSGDRPERNLKVSFVRTSYVKGAERVPLKVVIVGPTKETCETVWNALIEELSMTPKD